MKLIAERGALIAAIGAVAGVVQRGDIPILNNILVEASGNEVRFTGTDMDMQVSAPAMAQIDKPGAITVDAGRFADIVRALPKGCQVALADEGAGRLSVKAGRASYRLPTMPADDFPQMETDAPSTEFSVPGKDLLALLDRTRVAQSTEEVRYYLKGMMLHFRERASGPMLVGASTDGHRLQAAEIVAPDGCTKMPDMIVPTRAIDQMRKLLEGATGLVDVACDAKKLTMTVGDLRLTTKLVDGQFPDYQRVIPTGNDKVLRVDSIALLAAAKRVALVASDKTRAVKASIEPDKVILSCVSAEGGEATEELACNYSAQPLVIGFNVKYLTDIVSALGTGDVTFTLADPGAPVLVTMATQPSLVSVLMPMRV